MSYKQVEFDETSAYYTKAAHDAVAELYVFVEHWDHDINTAAIDALLWVLRTSPNARDKLTTCMQALEEDMRVQFAAEEPGSK